MKGISHFAIGIAAASCFPAAVDAAARGNPLYFILAGIFGLLPDTLDFKLTRFFYKTDITVTPDPNAPDARQIAEAVAMAVNHAGEHGRPVSIKLNTIQLGADRWQRYTVRFDRVARRVFAGIGPVVDTGGKPLAPASAAAAAEASAPLVADVELEYLASTDIDIFDGPVYRMEPVAGGRVRPIFIPWHRSWTHSFVFALLFALAAAALWDLTAGVIVGAAYAAHILSDQLGYMGSNLFAPFTRSRTTGLRLMHAVQSLPNFAAVWTSGVVVYLNILRARPDAILVNPLRVAVVWLALPILIFALLQRGAANLAAARSPVAPPPGRRGTRRRKRR